MKIGLLTDSLSQMPLPEALDATAQLGIEAIEIPTGNWSAAPHVRLDDLVGDSRAVATLAEQVRTRGLRLEALNCSGNPLHPVTGAHHDRVTRDTFRLANALEVDTVVMMSGLPAAPGDRSPNWITTCWPPETADILDHQWNEVAIPYWLDLAEYARECGVRVALELHPHQLVYNVRSFRRLRAAIGDTVGVNLDPSHLMWMGADPIAAVDALGNAIYHVHAKDTRIEDPAAVDTCYETLPFADITDRAWNYVTIGRGHPGGRDFWIAFLTALQQGGYQGALSIEHEDAAMSQLDGVTESVQLLRGALADQARCAAAR